MVVMIRVNERKMAVNISSIRTSSNGGWEGDNPLDYAFPLLIIQTTLILTLSRFIAFLFKPLRQPKVLAEMLGGILLGPSAFGRNEEYMQRIFPKWSTPILESIASIGLLFFLFLVGLELDLYSIRRTGWPAAAIAVAGILVTFGLGVGVALVFWKSIDGADAVGFTQYFVFIGVALSITAFPVLARMLAELKLLTTRLGQTAMAAAALNDVAAWILLALAVALAGNGGEGRRKSPLISIWILLSGTVFVAFMMVVVKPAMKWVERRCWPQHDAHIFVTLGGVLAAGFVTDLIGIHSIFGAFIFGLTIPRGGEFAGKLMERIEDFVSGLLLPLYFASSGLKTDVAKIRGGEAWGLLALVIAAASAGKIITTFAVAMMCMIPAMESITLGVLMNTKGLVDLIVLNIGREKKVLNDEAFAILVLMALVTTFLTTPAVLVIYKPGRVSSTAAAAHRSISAAFSDELRVVACVHGPSNIPSLLNLIETTRSTNKSSQLKLYVMHLVELTDRSSSIVMAQRLRKNGLPHIDCLRLRLRLRRCPQLADRVAAAFQAYSQLGRVSVRPATAISSLATMHEDICHVAEEKMAAMVVVPYHKQWRETEEEVAESVSHAWRGVNERIMKEAPCTVAVLVDRGFGDRGKMAVQNVCLFFSGGSDDEEVLELGGRMAEHPAVKVALIRFVPEKGGTTTSLVDKEDGEGALTNFINRMEGKVEFIEKIGTNIIDEVLAIGRSGSYDLIVAGKGWCSSTMLVAPVAEHPELGPIGDMLVSSGQGIGSSVLVVQQRFVEDQLLVSKVHSGEVKDGGSNEITCSV